MFFAGGLMRAESQDRIEFLAQMRNAALEPLWKEGSNGSAWGNEGGFKADRIVFINDVYFCARDVVSPSLCIPSPACLRGGHL
jgi:alpha-1,3-mannosyltransferase